MPERTKTKVTKIFPIQPQYSDPPNDYFMYSINNTTKEEVQNQVVVEKSLEMMCMFDDLPYIDDVPRYDLHNDDYMGEIEIDC